MKKTEKLVNKLLSLLSLGMPVTHACAQVNISKVTYYNWRKKDNEFNSRAEQAESAVMTRDLAVIEKVAQGDKERGIRPDWKAAAWRLEKRFPKEFGHLARVQLEGEVKTQFGFTDEELYERVVRALDREKKDEPRTNKNSG